MNECNKNMQYPCDYLTASNISSSNHKHSCDILLNNFKIKEKSYRVLLNCYHLVWERYTNPKENVTLAAAENQQKDVCLRRQQNDEFHENYHLTNDAKAYYGLRSNILPLTDIIRVSSGITKSNSLQNAYRLTESLNENDTLTPNTCQYLTIHYAKRLIKSPQDCNRYQVQHVTLHNPDGYIINKWQQQLQQLLLTNPKRIQIKRLLVFINPYGGRKRALQIYKHFCKPIIQLAGIDDCCIITQRSNQINDILLSQDLMAYDAVCCVGGDGTVAELVNGLIRRAMHDLNLDMKNPEYIPKSTMPIAIIPAGSTDTIAYSLHGTSDVQTATIHLVLGQLKGLDVCSIYNNTNNDDANGHVDCNGLKRFCLSLMGYGYLGDVAANSEKLRWLGTKRYEFAGIKAFLLNRGYSAEIKILMEEKPTQSTCSSLNNQEETICYNNCKYCNSNTLINHHHPHHSQYQEESSNKATHDIYTFNKIKSTTANSMEDNLKPLSNSNVTISSTDQWHVIQGEFFMVIGANVTCACTRSPHGLNRYGHLGDGYLELILIRKTNLFNNIRFIINSLSRNGDIRNLQFVEIYRTRQFHFKAINAGMDNGMEQQDDFNSSVQSTQRIAQTKDNKIVKHSTWNCDGEVLHDNNLIMTSHRQLINVLMRGPQPFIAPIENSTKCNIFCCCK